MKILFVVPPYYNGLGFVPEGIGIVATVAKEAGFDVSVLLTELDERPLMFHSRVVTEIKKRGIDVVAIGGQSPSYRHIEQLIAMAKNAGAITVLGGYIVDSAPEVVAANIGADYCVYGEGEFTFLELVQALQSGNEINNVRGLIYMQNGVLTTTPPRDCVSDLDTLPIIDSDLCHYDYSLNRNSDMTIMASRSCPFQCTFCYHLKGSRYRSKSLDYVFRELEHRLAQYGDKIKGLNFLDEMLNANTARLMQFCHRIKPYNLPFRVQLRVDCTDEESIMALKDAGATHVLYGLESASNRVLASMKKKLTINQIEKAFEMTHKHGLKVEANLIIGDIEDDVDTIRESETFYRKYSYKYDLNIVMINIYPGTHLYKHALSRGIIKSEIDFIKNGCPPTNVSKLSDDMYALLRDKYRAYDMSTKLLTGCPIEKDSLELSVDANGLLTFICYCPVCCAKSVITGIISQIYEYQFIKCPQCSRRIYPQYSRFFSNFDYWAVKNWIEAYLQKYQGCRIAVWGITDLIRRFIVASQVLRDMIVKIVDVNYQKFENETYCGLSVESPETLKGFHFDYLITPTVERRYEIIKSLENMGIEPRFIEFQKL